MVKPKPLKDRMIAKGCEVLYSNVAEAFEPRWKEVVWQIYQAMYRETRRTEIPYTVAKEDYDALCRDLAAPPEPNEKLKALMAHPPYFFQKDE